ncbi:MAG: methylaspartate ammonia-lyase [Fermentimonas sp.]|nr:methylaspartate ammonia-lyase [Fermentimonas sp.]
MKIKKLICSPGKTGFYFDDQLAIKRGAENDGAFYKGVTATPGFKSVRQAGESISIIFVLENGAFAFGDCAAVQYSGAGGRDPLFLADNFIPIIEKEIAPLFEGKDISTFKEMCNIIENAINPNTGKQYHTAIRYGITQACLDAVAKSKSLLMAEVIADEYGTNLSETTIPIFSQSGDDRYLNVDKMIMKRADVLPHALFNHPESKVGANGHKVKEYLSWLRDRIISMRPDSNYKPVIHIDLYGTLSIIFNNDLDIIANYISELEQITSPFLLRVEGPVDMGEKKAQMEALQTLRVKMEERGISAEIVADEWCNTLQDIIDFCEMKAGHMMQIKTPDLGGINNSIEAVLYCKKHGIGAYLGGTCNETSRSAEICAHIAMATQPDQILAKPGMGVDEGYMIVYNEIKRILAIHSVTAH